MTSMRLRCCSANLGQQRVAIRIALLLSLVLTVPPTLSLNDKPIRSEAEKAIRETAHDMMKAFLTQDVATFKRHSAKRTLELVSLTYEAARHDPRYQQELQNARITNADQFLGYFMLGLATQYLQAAPVTPEAAARRIANDSTISFISDSEANIIVGDSVFARARRVAREWKIDLTDSLKKAVLKEVTNPELRARIKSL
ncbi:MAG TPA: hypothetical protein VLM38_17655 [Blastocatellia bacterium]|nr:hypothetical protein [Blastocatellia bacterium]